MKLPSEEMLIPTHSALAEAPALSHNTSRSRRAFVSPPILGAHHERFFAIQEGVAQLE